MRDQHPNARRKAHLFVHLGGPRNSYISAKPFFHVKHRHFCMSGNRFLFYEDFYLGHESLYKENSKMVCIYPGRNARPDSRVPGQKLPRAAPGPTLVNHKKCCPDHEHGATVWGPGCGLC